MARKKQTITKDQVKDELLKMVQTLGRTPTATEFFKTSNLKGCHNTSLSMLFGKTYYNTLLTYSGVPLNISSANKSVECKCTNCSISFLKNYSQYKKSNNHFCSRSCAATYNNKNKSTGNRRSKLEIYLEEQLNILYPDLEIHYNRKDTIQSELDIYIPSLKLAFELNGIFHFEPIYGEAKLEQIQTNDTNKFQKCQQHGISLCIIDTSSQKRFTTLSSQKYLDIIIMVIERHIWMEFWFLSPCSTTELPLPYIFNNWWRG